MVNNAGVSVESTHVRALKVHETSEEDYDQTMAINAKGIFLGCKYATRQMLAQESVKQGGSRGWIVNTASVQGLVPYYGTREFAVFIVLFSWLRQFRYESGLLQSGAEIHHLVFVGPGVTR